MIWTTKPYMIEDVTPGMILGRPVMSEKGKVILSENAVLTDPAIRRLAEWGYHLIYIKEPTLESTDNLLSMVSERRSFTQRHTQTVKVLKDAFERTRFFKEVPLAQMTELADQSIDTMINTTGVISFLKSIRSTDDYTFQHSVNVGIIAGVLGKWMGIKGEALREVVLTGLLHDIGKTQVPLEILNKPGGFTPAEQETMQEHATFGYELMKQTNQLSKDVLLGVWQHHERMNGEGYPFGLANGDISLYARIIAVADTYDAMTTDRVYKAAVTPFRVVEEVFGEIFCKLDPMVSMTFLENLKDSLIGYVVRLSDGKEARVVYLDKSRPAQPVVKIGDGEYIDLEKRRDLNIVEVIST
ncbi:MAG: HD-GYP domain-containing protein [Negativicutes bacterium]|nr:HD-GYP domain-containing protein [Negativicutes bacterium]